MTGISDSEFQALISLLDDPDEEVVFHVARRLKELGIEGVRKLEQAWETAADELTQSRLENLISDIQFERLCDEIGQWARQDSDDLLLGAILVARFRYPELDDSTIYRAVDKLAKAIWLEFQNGLTPLEEIRVFNHVLYKLNGFIGDQEHYTNPEYGFINRVLELKKGNSHALGILYLILSQRLNLPVFGVPLPYFFVLAYVPEEKLGGGPEAVERGEVSFYINPVSEGTVFPAGQIDEYLKKMGEEALPGHYIPVGNVGVIRSLVHYLSLCYEQRQENDAMRRMQRLLEILDNTEGEAGQA